MASNTLGAGSLNLPVVKPWICELCSAASPKVAAANFIRAGWLHCLANLPHSRVH